MCVVLFFSYKPDLIFVQEIRKKIFFYSSQSSPTGAGPTRCAPYNHIYPPPLHPPPKSERTRTRRRTSSSSICCWPGVWPHVTTHVAPHLIDTMIMEGRRRRRSQKEEGDDDNNAGPGWLAGWLAPAVVIIIISVYTRAITSHQRRVQPRPFRLFLLLLLLPIRRRRRSHWAAALHISPGRPAEIIHAPAAGQGGEYIINDNQCSYILLYCPCIAEKKIYKTGPFTRKTEFLPIVRHSSAYYH